MYCLWLFFLLFPTLLTADVQISDTPSYLSELENLKKEENWQKIADDGEKALKISLKNGDLSQQFIIRDQLVSTYFRLGKFRKAEKHAESLLFLGSKLNQPEAVIDSFYKLSASSRGLAHESESRKTQKLLFIQAKNYSKKALDYCLRTCPEAASLKARVLYNYGAALSDDPTGDRALAISYYQDAFEIFSKRNEKDYSQRTQIRLAKTYLLEKNVKECKNIVEALKSEAMEARTHMHFKYLEATLLKEEKHNPEALTLAYEGKELATQLNASLDLKRFEKLIAELGSN